MYSLWSVYRYSVNTSDLGIKKVSQAKENPHKQRIYAICEGWYLTPSLNHKGCC